ncbi:MAG: hypothetical protein HC923_09430, partial [Myxococcales bacterium]|nr:hypothetical protein [Myxococcales bacterium]
MDVRCPECGTDYVFDAQRIGPKGVSVKCTVCTHVFRVFRPEQPKYPWLIRHPDGTQVQFQELTVLQKWIVEGRIHRQDEISRSGQTWKPLGEIKELEPFFRVYEEAEELRRLRRERGSEEPSRPPSTDLVRAIDPIDDSFLEQADIASVPPSPADLTPSRAQARPVNLTQRRPQRATDPLV